MNNNLIKNTKNKTGNKKINMFHIILIAIGIVSIVTTIIILIVHFTNQKQTYIVEYIPILTSGETNNMLVKYAMVTDKNLIEKIGKLKYIDFKEQNQFRIKYISKFPESPSSTSSKYNRLIKSNDKVAQPMCRIYKNDYKLLCNKDFVKAWVHDAG